LNSFYGILQSVRDQAEKQEITHLLNWFEHKDRNPWILQCLSLATSKMSPSDWYSTSVNTNISESAHANSQRDGTHLSLVAGIQRGERFDMRFVVAEQASRSVGVSTKYGNNEMSGRANKNTNRAKAAAKRKEKADPSLQMRATMMEQAAQMRREGFSQEFIEELLRKEIKE
jgi:hypothetical protein